MPHPLVYPLFPTHVTSFPYNKRNQPPALHHIRIFHTKIRNPQKSNEQLFVSIQQLQKYLEWWWSLYRRLLYPAFTTAP